MVDIITTIVALILLVLCAVYVVIEVIKRKQRKQDENILECNNDIRLSFVTWIFGAVFIIGFTIAHYVDPNLRDYIICCGIGATVLAMSYYYAFNKVIINKETGEMIAYRIIRKIKFNVKDITLLKIGVRAWTAYSNRKRLFHIEGGDRENDGALYYYIRKKSKCKQKLPKGCAEIDIEDDD